jgi:hypothetical protein
MKKNYTPYTYLIGWSKLDKWYYGSRYATKTKCLYESGCHPDDFWVTYHTSSNIVTAFREEHGEPDVIEIRKTFSAADDAKAWEHRILQRMNVVKNDKWLNDNDKLGPPILIGEKNPMYGKTGEESPNYGTKHTEEWKKKQSERMTGEKNPMYGKTTSEETLKKISEKMKGKFVGNCNPNYGKMGGKSVTAKKIKITYLGIEKIYSYMGLAAKDLYIPASTLSCIATGRIKRSIKYPGLRAEYV